MRPFRGYPHSSETKPVIQVLTQIINKGGFLLVEDMAIAREAEAYAFHLRTAFFDRAAESSSDFQGK